MSISITFPKKLEEYNGTYQPQEFYSDRINFVIVNTTFPYKCTLLINE